jgi:hypothetical protein
LAPEIVIGAASEQYEGCAFAASASGSQRRNCAPLAVGAVLHLDRRHTPA